MGVLLSWHGHRFELSPSVVRGFKDLSISWGSDTEEQEGNEGKHLIRKNAKPLELSMTIPLHAYLNNLVEYEARIYLWEAKSGVADYLYAPYGQMFPFPLMLTDIQIEDVEMNPYGVWISCNLKAKFVQSIREVAVVVPPSGGGVGKPALQTFKMTLTDARGNPVGQIDVRAASYEAAIKKTPESWKGTIEVKDSRGNSKVYDGISKKETSARTVGYLSVNKDGISPPANRQTTTQSTQSTQQSSLQREKKAVDDARNKGRSQTTQNTKGQRGDKKEVKE